ncbi:2-isopropylmalate synthase [uncultured archaeon]|nr:2-isopropylmalate synthase [uncultured archaeon]
MELYDCTLREGEQAKGASLSLDDRIKMCKLLDEFGVDYIELGWPYVSKEIFNSFSEAIPLVKRAKIVAFGSTSIETYPEVDKNLGSIIRCGAKYACIFGKTDVTHVEKQLGLSNKENLEKISNSVSFLRKNNVSVFYDAEHFFDGFKKNPEYAIETLFSAKRAGAERLILCDTNGGKLPNEVEEIVKYTKNELEKDGLEVQLGVHLHDDCGLALANTLVALPYIKQVQGTINGLGERVGNLNLTTFVANYLDKMNGKLNVDMKRLKEFNEESFRLCGVVVSERRPYVGETAFCHRGGVHVNAMMKGASYEHTEPEKFGGKRIIILNSLGGISSVVGVASQFGIELNREIPEFYEKVQKLMEELRTYERSGYDLGTLPAEQFLILNKYFGNQRNLFEIKAWNSESKRRVDGDESASFYALCDVTGKLVDSEVEVKGGPVEAGFNVLKKVLSPYYPSVSDLHLSDFRVTIAREREEESTVRNEIWFRNGKDFSTVGVDRNIIGSAVEALAKGFRYHLSYEGKNE